MLTNNTSSNYLTKIAFLLTSIGAINWGLISAFNFNLVEFLFGAFPLIVKLIYGAVGLSGLYTLYALWEMHNSVVERTIINK